MMLILPKMPAYRAERVPGAAMFMQCSNQHEKNHPRAGLPLKCPAHGATVPAAASFRRPAQICIDMKQEALSFAPHTGGAKPLLDHDAWPHAAAGGVGALLIFVRPDNSGNQR